MFWSLIFPKTWPTVAFLKETDEKDIIFYRFSNANHGSANPKMTLKFHSVNHS